MKKETLKKANDLTNRIEETRRDIADIAKILEDYPKMGMSIEVRRNDTGWSRSFGSKKYGFKDSLVQEIFLDMQDRLLGELYKLQEEFDNL